MSAPVAAPPSRRNLRLLIEYDGAGFLGWQEQADGPSIQGSLNQALLRLTGAPATLRAAGRTDAGVHARGQVASFLTDSRIAAERFAPGLNAYLPAGITVHTATEVPLSFDARRDSRSKRYRYRLYVAPLPAALERGRAWHLRGPLDLEAMRAAAALLLGEQDFNAFRSAQCDAPHARREMLAIDVSATPRPPAGLRVELTFHANAFCRHMCRILTGTLVEVGQGRRTVENVALVLAGRDRTKAGVTAPPNGLTLLEVLY